MGIEEQAHIDGVAGHVEIVVLVQEGGIRDLPVDLDFGEFLVALAAAVDELLHVVREASYTGPVVEGLLEGVVLAPQVRGDSLRGRDLD